MLLFYMIQYFVWVASCCIYLVIYFALLSIIFSRFTCNLFITMIVYYSILCLVLIFNLFNYWHLKYFQYFYIRMMWWAVFSMFPYITDERASSYIHTHKGFTGSWLYVQTIQLGTPGFCLTWWCKFPSPLSYQSTRVLTALYLHLNLGSDACQT